MISKITPMVVFDDWIVVPTEAIDTDTVLSKLVYKLQMYNVFNWRDKSVLNKVFWKTFFTIHIA